MTHLQEGDMAPDFRSTTQDGMPLTLAIVHSCVGLYVVFDTLTSLGKFNLFSTVLYIAFFIVVIYGGYFLATRSRPRVCATAGRSWPGWDSASSA